MTEDSKNNNHNSDDHGSNDDIWMQLLDNAYTQALKRIHVTDGPGDAEKPVENREIPGGRTGSDVPADPSDFQIHRSALLLGTYRVESDAIEGGMGSVWKVYHTGWDVDLAMKRPLPRFFAADESKTIFIDECKAWMELGLHPNIVSCYYVREIGGIPSIFSEWMDNGDLEHHIKSKTLYEGTEDEIRERLLDIAIQFARGLEYAHRKGMIHQDVKPDNLLLTKDWDAKVSDFGLTGARTKLAKLKDKNARPDQISKTLVAASGGYSLYYCSAEQLEGKKLTRRTDIYSWAVSVMEMYCKGHLWSNGVVAGLCCREYLEQCGEDDGISVPAALQTLLEKCMASDPDDRPHDFSIIIKQLLEIYETETGEPYPRPESNAAFDTADSLNNKALSYLDMGDEQTAVTLWNNALKLNPKHIDARFNRELFFVRSGKKIDFKAVDELNKYDETRDTGLPETLYCVDETIASKGAVNTWDGGKFDVHAYFSGNEMICFHRQAKLPESREEIVRIEPITAMVLETDPLEEIQKLRSRIARRLTEEGVEIKETYISESLPVPKTKKMLTVLYFEGRTGEKRSLQYTYYLCLYDLETKKVQDDPVLLSRGRWKLTGSTHIHADGTMAAFSFYVYGEYNFTIFTDLPSLRVHEKCERLKFCYFLSGGRCLLEGRNEKKQNWLFVYENDGTLREVFRTATMIWLYDLQKKLPVWEEPFLGYFYYTGKIFYLDDQFQKIPIENELYLDSDKRVDRIDILQPLKYDKKNHILYLYHRDRLVVWDLERMRRASSFISNTDIFPPADLSYDPESRILRVCSVKENKITWGDIYLPQIREEKARWQLSHIDTRKLLREGNQLRLLTEQFKRTLLLSDDSLRQLNDIFCKCCALPGFYGSDTAKDMQSSLQDRFKELFQKSFDTESYRPALDIYRRACSLPDAGYEKSLSGTLYEMASALETVAVKKALFSLRQAESRNRYSSDFVVSLNRFIYYPDEERGNPEFPNEIESCADHQFVLYSSGEPDKPCRLYDHTGKLIRRFKPERNVVFAAARDDHIITVSGKLECNIFNLNGMLERFLLGDRTLTDEKSVQVYDIDPGGNLILFRYLKEEEKDNLYQMDLRTGTKLRIQRSCSDTLHFRYLQNGNIIVQTAKGYNFKGGNSIQKFSSSSGEPLSSVLLNKFSLDTDHFHVLLNFHRDLIIVKTWNLTEDAEEIRWYDQSGKMIGWFLSPTVVDWIIFTPGNHLIIYLRSQRGLRTFRELCVYDPEKKEELAVQPVNGEFYKGYQIAFRPDLREIYIRNQGGSFFDVYHLNYDYELKTLS